MSLFSRLKNALFPQQLDDDLRVEMADHLERRAAALREQGLSDEDARRQSAMRFGNAMQIREQSREIRLSSFLETTFQDIRYAWRGMRKSPAFALTAILSLALAIGANTAIYSIVDAAILRPLPVPEPDRLITLATPNIQELGKEASAERESFSYPTYQQFRAAAGDSARLALFSYSFLDEVQAAPDAPVEKVVDQFVSGEAFEILRVPPALGRLFSLEDDRVPGGDPVVVISHDYWQRRFHGNPHVLGQSLRMDGKTYSIIGVARQGFFGVEPGTFVDLWVPAMMYQKEALTNSSWGWFRILGRLGPQATRAQLQARLQPVLQARDEELVKSFPTIPPSIKKQFLDLELRVHPAAAGVSSFRQTFARPLWIVLGVAAGILLLSSIAGLLGWVLARATAPALVAMLSRNNDPVRFALAMDTRVLLFCAAASTVAAVFFGLLPAWQASGAQPALRGARGHAGRLRLGRLFVGIQVAFAFCLVIAGASFLFSLRNLFAVDKGFDARGVAVISVSNDLKQKEAQGVFQDQFQSRLAALPGVQGVAAAPYAIFRGSFSTDQVILPAKPPSDGKNSSTRFRRDILRQCALRC